MNKMDVDLDVFCVLSLDRVGGHVDYAGVVAVDYGRSGDGVMKILKKLPQPSAVSNSVCNRTVFGLSDRVGTVAWCLEDHETKFSPR